MSDHYRLYNTAKVSELWGITPTEVRTLIKRGIIKPIIGFKGFRFDGTELKKANLERL
jgi:hypothetical protein